MTLALFAALPDRWADYEGPLRTAFLEAGLLDVRLVRDADPTSVDYIIYAPNSHVTDFTPYTRLKAVLNLWAGVEDVVSNATLKVPLTRMVDEGLTEGMVEWSVGHVMRHHLEMDRHILGQDGVWRGGVIPQLARDRTVAVLGLGALGSALCRALVLLGFKARGWSRRPKDLMGVACFSGDDPGEALDGADIVVMLLPDTPATERVIDAERIARLAEGAVIINPGRGSLIDDEALIAALDDGKLSHATLDVFREEPLPPEHPFWGHSKVTVTPHIASETRPLTASRVIAENIRRGEASEPLLHLVDRSAGY
jgi:glyoxylate/hydroxypyruvate reductase A